MPRRSALIVGALSATALGLMLLTGWALWPTVKRALLVKDLTSQEASPMARVRALEGLAQMGTAAVPELRRALKSQDDHVRGAAANALGRMGPRAAEAAPDLIAATDDEDDGVRLDALHALGRIGPGATSALPVLIDLLTSSDERFRDEAIKSLDLITGNTAPLLGKLLEHEDPEIRGWAIEKLRVLGARAQPAVPALRRAATKQAEQPAEEKILYKARQALVAVSPADSVPVLIDALQGEEGDHLVGVLGMLSKTGSEAAPAVPALRQVLAHNTYARARFWAAVALGKIGQAANEAVPELTDALDDDGESVAYRAVIALGNIGPDAKPAVPKILEHLHDENQIMREGCAYAIKRIDPALFAKLALSIDPKREAFLDEH